MATGHRVLMRLQHVSFPFPQDHQAVVRAFYGELLGLEEVPVPRSLADRQLVWYSLGPGVELHLFGGGTGPVPSDGRSVLVHHLCLELEDLDEVRSRLSWAGHRPFDDRPIRNRPRFFCPDPFGNLIEFTTIQGDYR